MVLFLLEKCVSTVKNQSSSSQVSKLNSSVSFNGGARRKPLFDVQKRKEFNDNSRKPLPVGGKHLPVGGFLGIPH